MIEKNYKHCNEVIIWPEIHIKKQRHLNIDGGKYSCNSIILSDKISSQASDMQLADVIDVHEKLLAKLIQRIETLEKRTSKE